MEKLRNALKGFAKTYPIQDKGALCVGLFTTRRAFDIGLPANPEALVVEKKGQVKGLGKSAVQRILREHGVDRVLAEEGGRTSRGSIDNMRSYLAFLNELYEKGLADQALLEAWWVERVHDFFAGKPFVLRFDSAKSIRAIVADLIAQARERQRKSAGSNYLGTMLQHLVGAKLRLLLPEDAWPEIHGASVADRQEGRKGDFLVADAVLHVTTAPNEAVIRKCADNLHESLHPIVVTLEKGVATAEGLAENMDIADRLDVFDAEQFLAGNLYEIGRFGAAGRRATAEGLIEHYNRIIDDCETDPGLRISMGSK